MKFNKIDIQKSIKKERVIQKTWLLEPMLDYFAYVIIIGFYPFLAGMFFFDQLEKREYLLGASILLIIALIFSGLIFYSIINLDILKRIKGVSKSQNRKIIKELVEELKWNLRIHNQQESIIIPTWNWFSTNWGRQIVIIYDQEDILINTSSYGLHGMKSPFHWFGNKKLEKMVKNNFEKKLNTVHR